MLLGSIIVGSIAVVKKPDLFKTNTIENSTQLLELKTFTDLPPIEVKTSTVSSSTKKRHRKKNRKSTTTTTTIASTKVKTLPGDNWLSRKLPTAIELSGTTTENYWKDYQLLGLYNIHGKRNGAPSCKRARDAFILGQFLNLKFRLIFILSTNGRLIPYR